jgi:EAL domain-containing protein (putative c-di-GMP-specific phosphodiesterase class I)
MQHAAGLAPALDQRVVARVLTQLHEESNSGLPYSVNLSATSLANNDWVLEIEDMVRGSAINPERLIFEITEKAAMENIDATAHFIERLRPAGARFALDDFGAGFSSFYYLKRFSVDILKVDGGFTRDLNTNAESRAFLRAVNGLAQDIGRIVIAKAVENEDVLKPLKETGTQYAQGQWFAPARPLSEAAEDNGTSISA